jgi:predicted ArsR family transcriptional regulator
MLNVRQPKPEHLEGVLRVLSPEESLTPQEIAQRSGLTLNAVRGAIDSLESAGKVTVIRQAKTPKLTVKLL